MYTRKLLGLLGVLALAAGMTSAMVTLPDSSAEVTFTATVSEQCNVRTLPTALTFNVTNIAVHTHASAAERVNIDSIVLEAGKRIRLSLKANTAAFTTSVTGAANPWAASAVSWGPISFLNKLTSDSINAVTASAGTLNNDATTYVAVVTSAANAMTLSTSTATDLEFTLAANTGIVRSGVYTLVATWKIEGGI